MAAAFHNLPVVQHQDLVGTADGGEAVGDDEGGAALLEHLQRILNQALRFGVDIGGGFIQYQNRRIKGQRSGEGNQLALSSRQRAAFFHNGLIKAMGEMGQQLVGANLLQRPLHTFTGDPLVSQAYIGSDSAREEVRVLQDDAHVAAQPLLRYAFDLLAVNRDGSALRIVEAEQQIDDRAFAGAGMADEGNGLAGARFEGDVLQDEVFFISKRDILEYHISLVTRHGSISNRFPRFIHQRKHPACGNHGTVEVGELVDHPRNRLEHPSQHIDERIQHTQ
ncbi:hypothetical protein D3C73_772090 [compost metagenome]